ncbi:hypothetical protein OG203_35615 [Nocardia sp. NBC_01499]|uniref:hypothetical protein n=1 Tax=Nocardia sp. NBC_01499 TaxID=2903597 RepID=UPI00386EE89E
MCHHDPEDAESAAVLSPEALLAAISGHLDSAAPLVGWARELAGLHAARMSEQADQVPRPIDVDTAAVRAEIARIIAAIDSWAAVHMPRNPDARKETHSLGEVLSHVAGTYVQARWTILHPADEQVQRAAWRHLGEAQEGYGQLVADINTHDNRVPLVCNGNPNSNPWPGERP